MMSATVFQAVSDAIYEVRAELLIFIIALVTHAVLFGNYSWKPSHGKKSAKTSAKEASEGKPRATPQSQIPGVAALIRSAKQLLRQGASRSTMVNELAEQLQANADKDVCPALASMLESVGRTANADLIAAVRTILADQSVQPGQYLGELMLRACLGLGLKPEFKEILAEVEESAGVTPAIAVLALRSTLRTSEFEMAMQYLQRFTAALKQSDSTASSSPQQLVQHLLQLASKEGAVPALLRRLAECGLLTGAAMESALTECAGKAGNGSTIIGELEQLAVSHGVELTDAASAAIIRGTDAPEVATRVFAEAVKRGTVGKKLLVAVLDAAAAHGNAALAATAKQHLPKAPTPEVAAALLRTIVDGPLRGKERDLAALSTFEKYLVGVDVVADTRTGRFVVEAALRHNKTGVLEEVMKAASDNRGRVALLKSLGAEQRLADATKLFRACPEKTVCLYNALLDSCIDNQDMEAAERIMSEAIAEDKADVVTYNTIIKKHLQRGHLQSARSVIEVMRSAGGSLAPNAVTFNELIDAAIKNDIQGVWVLIDEMKACGLKPNSVTCSILLKGVQHNSRPADVDRALACLDSMDDTMDEVLLSSVCEACIRAGRSDLLAKQLQHQSSGSAAVMVNGPQTFGSIIRAFGVLKDLKGAWQTWRQMRGRSIVPTSITIGCMVEALVSNGDPEGGFKLIHELVADEETKPLLNAIVYCSVLKGFTHRKMFDRVWVVYEEMVKAKLQFSIVTYNALIDACARNSDMSRVQGFLDDMAEQQIEPNIVTYSTILKGYCQENRLDKAFELLEAMKKSTEYRPDEITYNTLIDGCAQRGIWDQGMKLLEEMQNAGVPPSTFTLSVLVKLANRAKRPEKAFELVEDLSKRYGLRLNVHVYANLVHACTQHNDLRKALEVIGRMARERVRPDLRTYTLLLRALVAAGESKESLAMVRVAFGLRGSQLPPRLACIQGCEGSLRLNGGLPSDLVGEVLEAAARWGGEEHSAMQLCKDLRSVPGLRLDPKLSMSMTSRVLRRQ